MNREVTEGVRMRARLSVDERLPPAIGLSDNPRSSPRRTFYCADVTREPFAACGGANCRATSRPTSRPMAVPVRAEVR